eukprot:COSAG06_NODE_3912_length_4778_cov_545.291302_2_plen_192_part_00
MTPRRVPTPQIPTAKLRGPGGGYGDGSPAEFRDRKRCGGHWRRPFLRRNVPYVAHACAHLATGHGPRKLLRAAGARELANRCRNRAGLPLGVRQRSRRTLQLRSIRGLRPPLTGILYSQQDLHKCGRILYISPLNELGVDRENTRGNLHFLSASWLTGRGQQSDSYKVWVKSARAFSFAHSLASTWALLES